jgi:phosphate:Na+ symporter
LLAVIRGTPNARRTALAHVAFNVIAAVAGVALLPWMVPMLRTLLETTTDGGENVAVLLALYHTTFNVVGVVLMWPLAGRLERWLLRRFHSRDEEEALPRHLDSNTLAVPSTALVAVLLETRRLGHLAADALRMAFAPVAVPLDAIERRKATFDSLLAAISNAIRRLNHSELSGDVSMGLQEAVHATQHLLMAAEQAIEVGTHRSQPAVGGFDDSPEGDALAEGSSGVLLQLARQVVDAADPAVKTVDLASAQRLLGLIEEHILATQRANLTDAAMGRQSTARVAWMQSLMREVRRGARRVVRAAEIMEKAEAYANGNGGANGGGNGPDDSRTDDPRVDLGPAPDGPGS